MSHICDASHVVLYDIYIEGLGNLSNKCKTWTIRALIKQEPNRITRDCYDEQMRPNSIENGSSLSYPHQPEKTMKMENLVWISQQKFQYEGNRSADEQTKAGLSSNTATSGERKVEPGQPADVQINALLCLFNKYSSTKFFLLFNSHFESSILHNWCKNSFLFLFHIKKESNILILLFLLVLVEI